MPRKASTKKIRNKNELPATPKKIPKRVAKPKAVKKERVPKTRNAGTLTESQYWSKIRSGLRNAFRWWLPMQQALKLASRPSQSSNKRLKTEFQCAHCFEWFPRTGVEIDHVKPCGSIKCMEDIPGFIQRLTAEDTSSYQILCKTQCHKVKTLAEVAERKAK